jgi:glycerophosphoryl diester phosphodiesterase
MNDQIVVAHRGASGVAPENTLLAHQVAFDIGAHMIEIDVQETEDGELVCIHDYEVDRTTNGVGEIAEMSFNELRELDAGQGQKIPSLSEVLDFCRGKLKVNIELKVTDVEKQVLSLVQKRSMLSDIMISSFLHGTLVEARSLNPEVVTAVLVTEIDESIADYVIEIDSNALNPQFQNVSEGLIEELHKHNLQIFPWTVNDLQSITEMLKIGVDGIITDFPDRALEILKQV